MPRTSFAAFALGLIASSANAVCIHNGTLYAKTTLDQEFAESRWVVRARVESAQSQSGEATSWTLYRMRLVDAFKGAPPTLFTFYTRRDSGGFYMDDRRGRPDVGHDYLLFLNPAEVVRDDPKVAKGAMSVNYECGVSGPWTDFTTAQRNQLSALRNRKR